MPTFLALPEDLLAVIGTHLDEPDRRALALSHRAGRALVLAWRCGVVVQLPRGHVTRSHLLTAFGLKPMELPCTGVRFRSTWKYELRTCIPQILKAYGWRGIAERRRREADAAKARALQKAAAARAADARPAAIREFLRRVFHIESLESFESLLAAHRLDVPRLYRQYVTTRNGLPLYENVVEEVIQVVCRMMRRRELRAALVGSGITAAEIDYSLWQSYERGELVTETGIGVANRMLGEPWNVNFFRGPLCLSGE